MLKLRWVRALLGLDQEQYPDERRADADAAWRREMADLDESQARHLSLVAATLLGPARGIGTPGFRTPAEAAFLREAIERAARLHNEARAYVAQHRRDVVVRGAGK